MCILGSFYLYFFAHSAIRIASPNWWRFCKLVFLNRVKNAFFRSVIFRLFTNVYLCSPTYVLCRLFNVCSWSEERSKKKTFIIGTHRSEWELRRKKKCYVYSISINYRRFRLQSKETQTQQQQNINKIKSHTLGT